MVARAQALQSVTLQGAHHFAISIHFFVSIFSFPVRRPLRSSRDILIGAQYGRQGPGENGCVFKNRKTTYQRLARIYGFPYIGIKCLGKQNLDAQGAARAIRAGLLCICVRGGSGWYVAWQYWLYLHLQAKTEKARIREENDRIKKKERELKEAEKERKRIEALGVYYCIFLLQVNGQLLPCTY
jgi:hypothetical protein